MEVIGTHQKLLRLWGKGLIADDVEVGANTYVSHALRSLQRYPQIRVALAPVTRGRGSRIGRRDQADGERDAPHLTVMLFGACCMHAFTSGSCHA